MADRQPRARTTIVAGVMILGLTALFTVIGVDLARNALDASTLERETLLRAVGLGLNLEETRNLLGIAAAVVLILCVLTTIFGIGVLLRREGVCHAAVGTFVVFAFVTLPLALSGILGDDPPLSAWVGLMIGGLDVAVAILLLYPDTVTDLEAAEARRGRARSDLRAERVARRAGRAARSS
ncbi:MAG: hypothetical protein ACXWX0_11970 [Actinomycetota bacterium]